MASSFRKWHSLLKNWCRSIFLKIWYKFQIEWSESNIPWLQQNIQLVFLGKNYVFYNATNKSVRARSYSTSRLKITACLSVIIGASMYPNIILLRHLNDADVVTMWASFHSTLSGFCWSCANPHKQRSRWSQCPQSMLLSAYLSAYHIESV